MDFFPSCALLLKPYPRPIPIRLIQKNHIIDVVEPKEGPRSPFIVIFIIRWRWWRVPHRNFPYVPFLIGDWVSFEDPCRWRLR
jgi:hypothetical protein